MKAGKLAVIVLLLSSCLLASGNVYIFNNSGSMVNVSVKESAGIRKQTVNMNGGSEQNFTVGAGKVGAFRFVHISTLTVATLVDVHTKLQKLILWMDNKSCLLISWGDLGLLGMTSAQLSGNTSTRTLVQH
ncbi:unnamed protein product, partial [Sphagnum jensenii]